MVLSGDKIKLGITLHTSGALGENSKLLQSSSARLAVGRAREVAQGLQEATVRLAAKGSGGWGLLSVF